MENKEIVIYILLMAKYWPLHCKAGNGDWGTYLISCKIRMSANLAINP